jgi:integrase
LLAKRSKFFDDKPVLSCVNAWQCHYSCSESGEDRILDLDSTTIGLLLEHRRRQDAERAEWGPAYNDHGLVFAQDDGNPLPPNRVSMHFAALVKKSGLRRVRLHDLRHGRASLLLASGTDIAIVSKLLGHSSIAITSDTYSHVLAGVGREAAEPAARWYHAPPSRPPATSPPTRAIKV